MEAIYSPIPSPLQLDRYFLKGLQFQLKEGFDRGGPYFRKLDPPDLEIGVVSAENDDDDHSLWRFEVCIKLPCSPDDDFPYYVATTLVGYFKVSETYPAEKAEQLARVNGPAVLYSCAREIVATITGRSPYPKLIIPSVTFWQPEIATSNGDKKTLTEVKPLRQLTTGESEEKGSDSVAP
jgi:preprotein translocase subunit SecB